MEEPEVGFIAKKKKKSMRLRFGIRACKKIFVENKLNNLCELLAMKSLGF